MTSRVSRLAVVCALVLAASCAVNPVTGERELMLVSEEQEIQIGQANDEQIVRYYGLYEDADLAAWVDRLGQRMAAASERPDLPWTFRVVDDTAVNAFALPGGFVYLTRGILSYMTSEAEVAGVLGHEIGHVTARHSAQQISRAQLAQLGLGVGSVLSSRVRALGGVLETGVSLLFLKFSRDDESQADELGVRYAASAGYDPRALASFFDTVGRLSDANGGRLPTWLSTHPAPEDRQRKVLEMSAPLVAGASLTVGRDDHLRRIDGIVFGPDPRQGVLEGRTFKHPDLLFQLDYPEGWAVQNGKTAVTAAPDNGEAVLGLVLGDRGGQSLEAYARGVIQEREPKGLRTDEVRISGYPGIAASYTVEAEGVGEVGVREVFLEYRGGVYDMLGYARAGQLSRYESLIGSWQQSFRELPGSEASRYRPDRVDVFPSPRGGPLSELVRPSAAAGLVTLALINGLEVESHVAAGTLLKTVAPGYARGPS